MTLSRSNSTLPLLHKPKEEKYFVFKKRHDMFTHSQVVKYTVWFNRLSKNQHRTVHLNELAQEFVKHKLIRSKMELINAFATFLKLDIGSNDTVHTVTIDDFFDVLSRSGRFIDIEKLDKIVDNENKLSEKTLLVRERRKLLFEYIVEESLERCADMDTLFNHYTSKCHTKNIHHIRALEEKNVVKSLLDTHKKQVDDANQFIGKVEFEYYCNQYNLLERIKAAKSSKQLIEESLEVQPAETRDVMRPLEELLEPHLLEMANDTRRILYEDMVHDSNFNKMLSPVKVSSVRSQRSSSAKAPRNQQTIVDLSNRRPATCTCCSLQDDSISQGFDQSHTLSLGMNWPNDSFSPLSWCRPFSPNQDDATTRMGNTGRISSPLERTTPRLDLMTPKAGRISPRKLLTTSRPPSPALSFAAPFSNQWTTDDELDKRQASPKMVLRRDSHKIACRNQSKRKIKIKFENPKRSLTLPSTN